MLLLAYKYNVAFNLLSLLIYFRMSVLGDYVDGSKLYLRLFEAKDLILRSWKKNLLER